MDFILAAAEHLNDLCRITDEAKAQLKMLGLDQWQKGYPSRDVWENDIMRQTAWVAVEGNQVLGAFAFQTTPDASYGEIDGQWLTDGPYASMHRVCVAENSRGKGVAGELFRHGIFLAKQQGLPSMRMDTHPGNRPMQRALEGGGFMLCGTILLKGGCEDGDCRVAYEKIL